QQKDDLAHFITARSMTMLPDRRWSAPPLIRLPHIVHSLRSVARKIRVLRDALEVGVDRLAEHGEPNRRFAFKKRAAQRLLQPHNRGCQRRLGDAAASGGPSETALRAERQKIPDLMQFHGLLTPSASIVLEACHRSPALGCEVVHTSTIFLAYFARVDAWNRTRAVHQAARLSSRAAFVLRWCCASTTLSIFC